MNNGTQDDEDKLGHDPLEWLSEEVTENPQSLVEEASAPDTVVPTESDEKPQHEEAQQLDVPEEDEASLEFVFEEKLTVQGVESTYGQLSAWYKGAPPDETLILNLSETRDLDSSGYQLIVGLARTLVRDKRAFRVAKVNESLHMLLKKLGDTTLSEHIERE